MRKVALTAITIATLLVLATGVSCTSTSSSTTPAKPEEAATAALRGHKGRNQHCDTCQDGQGGDIQMQLYVFVPGKPDMDDFDAAEKMLQGEDSTAMGFSSRGCLDAAPPPPARVAFDLVADAGLPEPGSSVNVFQAGPPPPRVGSGVDSAPPPPPPSETPPPGAPPPEHKKPVHACNPPSSLAARSCQEPVGAGGYLQPDGVVYFKAITGKMNDYRFIPCKYAREKRIRSYDDVALKLAADQWIHFTGTHSGAGPTWAVTRQP